VLHTSGVVLAASGGSGGGIAGFIPLLLLVVVGYFLLLRPARQRQRKALETRNNIVPGVEVVTTAGLIANVVETDDETVILEIAPGVRSRFLRQSIARVVVPPEPPLDDQLPDGSHDTTDPGDDTTPHQQG
jgi:preprotein translocase subunit YajC